MVFLSQIWEHNSSRSSDVIANADRMITRVELPMLGFDYYFTAISKDYPLDGTFYRPFDVQLVVQISENDIINDIEVQQIRCSQFAKLKRTRPEFESAPPGI